MPEHRGHLLSDFFGTPPAGRPGLVVFLNAGDPPLDVLRDVVHMLDDCGVDCLELAVPFPDSPTDGPVIQRSARRALDHGVELGDVLRFTNAVHSELRHLKIVLLADWSYTVRPVGLPGFLSRVRDSGSDALLVHALPPRVRPGYYEAAHGLGLPVVTTCYATSETDVLATAGRHASAYLYLVSRYGRSGTGSALDYSALSQVLATVRAMTEAQIAVGFGVATRSDIEAIGAAGADAVVVGSAAVRHVESALGDGRNVAAALHEFVDDLWLKRFQQSVSRRRARPSST